MRVWGMLLLGAAAVQCAFGAAGWSGVVRNSGGAAVIGATVSLRLNEAAVRYRTRTRSDGRFEFGDLTPADYQLSILQNGSERKFSGSIRLPTTEPAQIVLGDDGSVTFRAVAQPVSSGGEVLAGQAVAEIPLNKRDFSQLLLLAAGTMTDSNGATNFTQQFAINGQRGVEAVFAMDGADISDPEMGGATFSTFNVDAVAEIQSSSGWMAAEIGRGAAGFTNIVTRSGTNLLHGSAFEFLRNSVLDARNFFDKQSTVNPGRIPPFHRNEFGVTLGGPVVLPGVYDGRDKTFFYTEYQGFRQVLGTTQVLPVPTAEERSGRDTTAFAGDTLFVPVNAQIAPVLKRYPLPNDPGGPFGTRTFATSSKVNTIADQFSARLDHKLSSKDTLFARFSRNNVAGPTTNPDQTAIDASFGILYVDHQRNGVVTWTRTPTANVSVQSSLSVTRTTPSFPTPNRTDAALTFGDGVYEPFNSAGGSVVAALSNLYQGRETVTWTHGAHAFKAGGEFRANRDSTYFGTAPNGQYTFGGGAAYSPVRIASASGLHDVNIGDALPDTLSGLLTGSAFSYSVAVAPPSLPQGDQIGVAAASRYNLNLFWQDTWKLSRSLVLDYGLRYELYTPITERAHRSAGISLQPQEYLINPQPVYRTNANNWGPRVKLTWSATPELRFSAGGGLTTIPPNIWQDNLLTGAAPYVNYPRLTASPGAPLLLGTRVRPQDLPGVFTPDGRNILATNDSKAVPANTVWDIDRFERGIAELNPSHQISPLNVAAISQDFRNAYLASWTFGMERQFGSLTADAGYVGTAGIGLPAINFLNGYAGAAPSFAPYTRFDAAGQPAGGFGTLSLMTNRSHSSYHALQTSLQGTVGHGGPSIQASYTFGKSIDDVSTVIGGFVSGAAGAVAQANPQNPFDTRNEKGPSTFDITHSFTLSAVQDLGLERVPLARSLGRRAAKGWQLLSVVSLASGSPFTIYSGVQQTGVGSNGVDRPDQIGTPRLSTGRTVREDYFGRAADNTSFFSIPIGVTGGTGPNSGVFGSLGRNTFRGPALTNFDFALIKDTSLASSKGRERAALQFRAEFFNLFNIVNFGLPANTIRGSGFGQINRTATNSRQVQLSLKLMF